MDALGCGQPPSTARPVAVTPGGRFLFQGIARAGQALSGRSDAVEE